MIELELNDNDYLPTPLINLIPNNGYIVDFQGYNTKNKFYFKEFAIYSNRNSSFRNYFCKTPRIDNNSYKYLLKCHHRIPFYFGQTFFMNVINELKNAEIIFCKGENKKQVLQKYLDIPIVNLEEAGCPNIRELPSSSTSPELFASPSPPCECLVMSMTGLAVFMMSL